MSDMRTQEQDNPLEARFKIGQVRYINSEAAKKEAERKEQLMNEMEIFDAAFEYQSNSQQAIDAQFKTMQRIKTEKQ